VLTDEKNSLGEFGKKINGTSMMNSIDLSGFDLKVVVRFLKF
jgi:hypothetical protein